MCFGIRIFWFYSDDVELSRQLLSVGMREHTQELAAIVGFSLKCHKLKQRANSVTILQQQKMDNAVRRSIFFICIRAENRDSSEEKPDLHCKEGTSNIQQFQMSRTFSEHFPWDFLPLLLAAVLIKKESKRAFH